MMSSQQSLVVNAYIIMKYTDGNWSLKNYWGYPIRAFYEVLDEMVASDFTEYVLVVYFGERHSFDKAVLEKGDSRKEFTDRAELKDWLLEKGGKEIAAIAEVYL